MINFKKDMWTPETTRRALRTFFQVFMGVIAGGISAVVIDFGTPQFKLGLFALITTAVSTALAAVMNIERVPDGNPGTDDPPEVVEYTIEDVAGVVEPNQEDTEGDSLNDSI